jgi:hypothetical protein
MKEEAGHDQGFVDEFGDRQSLQADEGLDPVGDDI